jgi:anti-sigma B factor antagonist
MFRRIVGVTPTRHRARDVEAKTGCFREEPALEENRHAQNSKAAQTGGKFRKRSAATDVTSFWAYTEALGAVVADKAWHDRPGRPMPLNIDVSRTKDIAIVRCHGRIVFGEEADELRRVILDLLKETQRIVLNLAWIEYVDSSGIGVLVASFISARHRGAEIKLAALGPRAHELLATTNVEQLFEVYGSADEAVRSFHSHPEAAAG